SPLPDAQLPLRPHHRLWHAGTARSPVAGAGRPARPSERGGGGAARGPERALGKAPGELGGRDRRRRAGRGDQRGVAEPLPARGDRGGYDGGERILVPPGILPARASGEPVFG